MDQILFTTHTTLGAFAIKFARSLTLILALSSAAIADDGTIIFSGYDPLWQAPTVIEERDGQYWMDGQPMEEIRHLAMPTMGLSLALQDRIGSPDNYFLIHDQVLHIYTNCELGPCTLRRSISQSK